MIIIRRCWPGVCKDKKYIILALGSDQDFAVNQEIIDELGVRAFNLAGKTTLRQTAALLKRCRLGIGADTGTAHIACAVGTPAVIVLGGGHFGRFLPYSHLTSIVCLPLECYNCNWQCRCSRVYCIKDIKPEVLAEAVRQTLERTSPKPRIFVQGFSLWEHKSDRPRWQSFHNYLNVDQVEIVPIGDIPSFTEAIWGKLRLMDKGARSQFLRKAADESVRQGEELFSLNDFEGAELSFFRALELQFNYSKAWNNLGVLYNQMGDNDKALKFYEAAVNSQQDNVTFVKNLADFYYVVQKDAEKALKMYIKGLTINPEDIEILTTLGNIAIETGQSDSAIDFYRKILKIDPENSDARQIIDLLNKQNQDIKTWRPDAVTIEDIAQSDEYLVSAIVSTYNSERFFRGCIEDLEAQTIANRLEIVVVDSCSQQNERGIIEEFQKKYHNIKYIRTENRETVYAAWNRGIKAASGKYITNANTDDRHRADAFEQMVKILEGDPGIALVYADLVMTERENETFDRHTPCGSFTWLNWDRNKLLEQGCFMGPQPMWRKAVHEEYGYFDESMVTSGDYEFWLRISQTNNFYHINSLLGLYLKSPQSIEHRNRVKQQEENNKLLSLYREAVQKMRIVKFGPVEKLIELSKGKNIKDRELLIQLISRIEKAALIESDQSKAESPWSEQDGEMLENALKSGDDRETFRLLKKAVISGDSRKYLTDFISLSSKLILSRTSWWPQKSGMSQNNVEIAGKAFTPGLTSIVIHSLNNLKQLRHCIEEIGKYTPEQYEMIFVGFDCPLEITKWLKKQTEVIKHYKYVEARREQSRVQVLNEGISVSSGEFIVLLSSAAMVSEHWLSDMLECLHSTLNTGIIGPFAGADSGSQRAVTINKEFMDERRLFREKNRHRRISTKDMEGSCMLFRSNLLSDIGLFDEVFVSGKYMFTDLCFRSVIAGYKNFIAGDVFVRNSSPAMSGNVKIFDEKWSGIAVDSPLGKKVAAFNFIEKADKLQQRGQLDKAIAMLIEGIKYAPEEKDIYYNLAEMLLDEKQYKDALEAVNSILPEAKDDLRRLGIIAYCTEELEDAEKQADRILGIDQACAPAWNLKGVIAHEKGDDDAAEGYFVQAIALDPGYGAPYTNRGLMQWTSDNKGEALDLLEKGFILSPLSTDSVTLYHSAITALEEFERAEKIFRDAKELHPENKRILFFLIDMLINQGKFEKAMHEVERAMLDIGIDDGMLPAALALREKIGIKGIDKAMKNKGTLSLCMIVKNEEKHLARCLLSAGPAVDEMIIVDTGSTDRTKDIARAYGAKVFDLPWTNDFSEARNCSLSGAAGDWILVLDADEVISPLDYAGFERIVKNRPSKPVAYTMITRNYTYEVTAKGWTANDRKYLNEEAGTGWFPSAKVRLFVNDKRIRFQNPVHEFVEASLEKAGIEIKMAPPFRSIIMEIRQGQDHRKGEEVFSSWQEEDRADERGLLRR